MPKILKKFLIFKIFKSAILRQNLGRDKSEMAMLWMAIFILLAWIMTILLVIELTILLVIELTF